MDGIAQTTTLYGGGNHRWMADLTILQSPEPGTLNGSLFPANTFPDGLVPSGVVLGRVTVGGLLGPYDNTATDGREKAVGHLVSDQVVRAGSRNDVAYGNTGAVIENALPANSGFDAAAKADLVHIRYRNI